MWSFCLVAADSNINTKLSFYLVPVVFTIHFEKYLEENKEATIVKI